GATTPGIKLRIVRSASSGCITGILWGGQASALVHAAQTGAGFIRTGEPPSGTPIMAGLLGGILAGYFPNFLTRLGLLFDTTQKVRRPKSMAAAGLLAAVAVVMGPGWITKQAIERPQRAIERLGGKIYRYDKTHNHPVVQADL